MDFEVNRQDLRETRVIDRPPPRLEPGQLRLSVERFALTSNNVSYAVAGDVLGYWDFFPADPPWGRIPAMGFASVVESTTEGVDVGGRYFGWYPMADQVLVEARSSQSGFSDVGAHRAGHARAYTSFVDVTTDPTYREDRADEYLLLRGLFMTSYLVEDFLDDNGFHGASQTLVTSASSKTSIALGSRLAARGHHSVGLTSAGNRAFVERLGLYDEVLTYDHIETLDAKVPSVAVDMAGSADLRSRIHRHFGDQLRYSCLVGATHWEDVGSGTEDLPGPKPEFFFAPTQVTKRGEEWGQGELMRRMGDAFGQFLETAPEWLTVERGSGPEAVEAVYREVLDGRSDPSVGHVLSIG